ncbi:MAG: HAD family hydrolase [Bdellovibrionales bacterium]
MPVISKPSAVLFDWDGTLINSIPYKYEAINKIHDFFGQPHEDPLQVRHYAATVKEVNFPIRFGAENAEKALEMYAQLIAETHDRIFGTPENLQKILLPGADAILEYLHDMNVPMSIVSNNTSSALHHELASIGWGRYFKNVYGASDLPYPKPDARAALHALKSLVIRPDRSVWFIGDSPADIACANNAGLTSILITSQPYRHESAPMLTFTGLPEFLVHIRNLR